MPTLHWVGKDKVKHHHRDVPYRVLVDDHRYQAPAGSPDNSSANRIIQGDNLEALKSLLPEFEAKVQCIYIDPPYNTGNESWVYNDNVNDPRIKKWLGQVVGKEGEDMSRHDKWLCMMYPRLKLLHRLLAHDGVLLVSIDDNEVQHLRPLMDELFGSKNRIEQFIWKKSYGGGAKERYAVTVHEYVLMYAKNIDAISELSLPPDPSAESRYYKLTDEKLNTRGPFRIKPLEATKSMDRRDNLNYPIEAPDGSMILPKRQWWWAKERVEQAIKNNELYFGRGKSGDWSISYKQYLRDDQGIERQSKPFSIIDGIYTQTGSTVLREIFDSQIFQFPKPPSLISLFLSMLNLPKDAIILDSFAGSGTTAHAVLKLNAQDGGNRRFILIEMMDYANSLTAERARRVMAGYGTGDKAVAGLGGGFVYQQLGAPLFDGEQQLNPAVAVQAVRAYIAWQECIPRDALAAVDNARHPYWLGEANGQQVFFCYEPQRITCLDLELLAELIQSPAPTLFYADQLALGEDFMRTHKLRFKKIPRDISRL
ncbi:site-specific DNA-methyltransferase [Pseudomonas sp.]|uniref:site-specific DNA-methyltransferase n=1 Tax=Pseudomonas sp. TaxID=306 RepID=UPI0027327B6A|nr:site-specific DNA-methyltransferase [Pseudomonas sp.]MDP3814243.1 site-specific DNA-methyltransferase [Pseudomonas sp.]